MKPLVALLPLLLVAACGDEPAPEPAPAPRGKPIAEPSVARGPDETAATQPRTAPVTPTSPTADTEVALSPSERLSRAGFEALRMTDDERAALAQVLADNQGTQLPPSAFPERVRELDGATAAIRGWMIPGRMEKRDVRDFMLVRDNQACCFGAMPTFDEWIHVEMEPDAHAEYLRYVEMEVTGTLQVGGLPVAEGVQPPALRMRATRCRAAKEPRVR